MKPQDFRFLQSLRVRWAEVDMQKIVFNGHYLMYFDTAVGGYWRALAMPYHETMAQLQGDLYVRKATLEYLGSARYDEKLDVGISCRRIGNSSLLFAAAVFRGPQCLVQGELVYVFADPVTQTSRPVPETLRQLLSAYEAGETLFKVQVGAWSDCGPEVQAVRGQALAGDEGRAVFPLCDDGDTAAVHALAYNRFGVVLSCGRLTTVFSGRAQIDRLFTAAAVRGAGLGGGVLQALLQVAKQRGDREALLQAPSGVAGFFERFGFAPNGPVFEEAGEPQQALRLTL